MGSGGIALFHRLKPFHAIYIYIAKTSAISDYNALEFRHKRAYL